MEQWHLVVLEGVAAQIRELEVFPPVELRVKFKEQSLELALVHLLSSLEKSVEADEISELVIQL